MTRILTTVGFCLLAACFGWAGAAKAVDPAAFAQAIASFRVAPWTAGVALAFYLPWLELAVALALFVLRWRRAGLPVATALSAAFVVLWSVTVARGLDVTCGCFGSVAISDNLRELERAVAMLAVCVALLWIDRQGGGEGDGASRRGA